jgi:predicted RNA-binding Zn-ribbon protein involved in translation (DUF1610 family)
MTKMKRKKEHYKCPKCDYRAFDKYEFMHGSIRGAFTCPVCHYGTDHIKRFKTK